jgi:hypothetical protein
MEDLKLALLEPFIRLDYEQELGRHRAAAILLHWWSSTIRVRFDPGSGCWHATVCLNEGGYACVKAHSNSALAELRLGQVPFKSSGTNFLLHRIAFLAWYGQGVDSGAVVSHLCGNRDSFCPFYIVAETQSENLARSRVRCPGTVVCLNHGRVLGSLC